MADRIPRRRCRAVASAAVVVGALLAGIAVDTPADAATASSAATVTVAPDGAGALGSGALRVRVAVQNDGSGVLPAGTVELALEQATVADAQTLTDRLADPTPYGQLQGYGVGSAPVGALAPGAHAVVSITIPSAVLGAYTQAAGAHLVAAQLRVADAAVAAGASAVVRAPSATEHVRLATVVPMTLPVADAPTGLASAAVVDVQSSPGGGWAAALDAVRADPAAVLALDPAVLASIRLLGSAAPASGTALLRDLAEVPNTTIELPYADGDVALERAAGATGVLTPTGFSGTVALAASAPTPSPTPTPVAKRTATSDPTRWTWSSTRIGWPAAGSSSTADLPFLAHSGDAAVLLSSADVHDTAARRAAGPLATVGGARVLVSDAGASTLLAAAASARGPAADAALADLSGLLAVDATAGGTPTILAVPGRTPPRRLADVLGRLRAQGWVQDADLAALTTAARPARVTLVDHAPDAATTARAGALIGADKALSQLGAAVPNGQGGTLTGPYRLSVLAMLGTGWRQAKATWTTDVAATTSGIRGLVGGAVQLLPFHSANIVGVDTNVPFTVRSTLPVPIRVTLSGVPSNGRVVVGDAVTRTVGANQSATLLSLPTRAISNGDVQITAQLATPGGLVLGPQRTVDLTVNAGWDTLGAGIFMVALLALFVVGVYRNLTRRRRRLTQATA